jgi:hypothetical protein
VGDAANPIENCRNSQLGLNEETGKDQKRRGAPVGEGRHGPRPVEGQAVNGAKQAENAEKTEKRNPARMERIPDP